MIIVLFFNPFQGCESDQENVNGCRDNFNFTYFCYDGFEVKMVLNDFYCSFAKMSKGQTSYLQRASKKLDLKRVFYHIVIDDSENDE